MPFTLKIPSAAGASRPPVAPRHQTPQMQCHRWVAHILAGKMRQKDTKKAFLKDDGCFLDHRFKGKQRWKLLCRQKSEGLVQWFNLATKAPENCAHENQISPRGTLLDGHFVIWIDNLLGIMARLVPCIPELLHENTVRSSTGPYDSMSSFVWSGRATSSASGVAESLGGFLGSNPLGGLEPGARFHLVLLCASTAALAILWALRSWRWGNVDESWGHEYDYWNPRVYLTNMCTNPLRCLPFIVVRNVDWLEALPSTHVYTLSCT